MTTMTIARTVHATRLGNLTIEASDFGLTRVAFTRDIAAPATDTGIGRAHVFEAGRQIDEYLAGGRRDFTVPIDWSGVSAFDATVLQILHAATGYGETTSYGVIAQRMGRTPTDARKIGGALARNRVLIIVPCHRVLAADGSLTGYAGGLAVKRALLDLESPDTRLALDGI
ncbi:MAG: methylated-DNA-[protein]-cysteine S-methyltransferase [Mycobacterium sp.]|jgi:methylated-DNA-[protein]-cysteine S-methyltransferase|nr:methylated-DNA-[protein]-cysteine S-methyltransferase [Mycobacterium sp.]